MDTRNNHSMKIVADENLKYVEQLFSEYGELNLLPGRAIDADAVADAQVLLVRSVTKVDAALLDKSQVRFVGTATSGVEHVDQLYLKEEGIGFAHAKGSNANAVAEYCLASLCLSHEAGRFDLATDCVGLVGCGHVGGTLALLLRKLDIPVSVFDPFLSLEQTNQFQLAGVELVDLEKVFDCSAVSLHVPLTTDGRFPTANMVGGKLLARLGSSSTFINASRGGVVNEAALLECLGDNPEMFAVLDVWESEPTLNTDLLARANVATPHIAGYSRQAKARATEMLAVSYRDYLKLPAGRVTGGPSISKLKEIAGANDATDAIKKALQLNQLASDFKQQTANLSSASAASVFDSFRKSMINRDEFSDFNVNATTLAAEEIEKLKLLGFRVTSNST